MDTHSLCRVHEAEVYHETAVSRRIVDFGDLPAAAR
jgi:hypothetical protein